MEQAEEFLQNVLKELSTRKTLTVITVQGARGDNSSITADLEEFDFALKVSQRRRILGKAAAPEPLDAGLLERVIAGRQSMGGVTPIHLGIAVSYSSTSLGESFIKACRPPTATGV